MIKNWEDGPYRQVHERQRRYGQLDGRYLWRFADLGRWNHVHVHGSLEKTKKKKNDTRDETGKKVEDGSKQARDKENSKTVKKSLSKTKLRKPSTIVLPSVSGPIKSTSEKTVAGAEWSVKLAANPSFMLQSQKPPAEAENTTRRSSPSIKPRSTLSVSEIPRQRRCD